MKVTCHQISLPESNYYDFHTTFTDAGLLPPPVLVKAKKPSVGRVKTPLEHSKTPPKHSKTPKTPKNTKKHSKHPKTL